MAQVTKIQKVDRKAIRFLQEFVQENLQERANEEGLGVTFTLGSGRYSNGATGRITIEVSVNAPDGSEQTKEMLDYKEYAGLFQLDPGYLGKAFVFKGRSYTVAGLRPGATKFPVLATRDDGKRLAFPAETVARLFGKAIGGRTGLRGNAGMSLDEAMLDDRQ